YTDRGMNAPIIAMLGFDLPGRRITGWADGGCAVPRHYLDPLLRAGAIPTILPQYPAMAPEDIVERFDGLLLLGGGDVEPSRYGAKRHRRVYGVDPERDELEIGLVRAAVRAGIPTLGICRGPQVVNVAFGGTLHPHLPDLE